MENELFVANDGGRWFIMQNHDTEDAEGYMGMWTEYKGNQWGYDTREEAERAMAELS